MIRFTVEGIPDLIARLGYVERGTADLRQLGTWDAVQKEFYAIEKEAFASEGGTGATGKWAPLTAKYKAWKLKKYGPLPILQRTGQLYKEMTTEAGVVEKKEQEMTLGSNLKYAGYADAKRKVVSLTAAQEERLEKPIVAKMKQLIANAKLRDIRGF